MELKGQLAMFRNVLLGCLIVALAVALGNFGSALGQRWIEWVAFLVGVVGLGIAFWGVFLGWLHFLRWVRANWHHASRGVRLHVRGGAVVLVSVPVNLVAGLVGHRWLSFAAGALAFVGVGIGAVGVCMRIASHIDGSD